MTLEEFVRDVLGDDEIKNYSQKQIEFIYNAHMLFANFIYKKWVHDRTATKKSL